MTWYKDKAFLSLIVIGAVLVFGVIPFFSALRTGQRQALRDRATALNAAVEIGALALDSFRVNAVQDSISIARLQGEITLLEGEANVAHLETLDALSLLEGARLAVREDTLSPALQNLLRVERAVAESYRVELTIADARITRLDGIVRLTTTRADDASRLLWLVEQQRDTALSIVADYERRLEFSLANLLFQDLPRKAACAGGGATVAAFNKGDVMLGAVIALVTCLAVESVLK